MQKKEKHRSNHFTPVNLPLNIKELIKKGDCTELDISHYIRTTPNSAMGKVIHSLSMYACRYNNKNVLDNLIKNYNLDENDKEGILIKICAQHNSLSCIETLLENYIINVDKLKDGCVLACQYNNVDILSVLIEYAKKDSFFSLDFNNRICMRLAISNRNLEVIEKLNDLGLSPFRLLKYHNKHLNDIIIRDDEEWLSFYLEKNILKAEHLILNENHNIFFRMLIANITNNPKYEKAFYYADKIINHIKTRKDGLKELVKIYKTLTISYPEHCPQVVEFKNNLRTTIIYEDMQRKLTVKENIKTIKNKI